MTQIVGGLESFFINLLTLTSKLIHFLKRFKLFIIFLKHFRRKITDDIEDEEVELTKEETKLIRRLLKGHAPHADFDPHAVSVLFSNFTSKCD